jgi:hypothetical protein
MYGKKCVAVALNISIEAFFGALVKHLADDEKVNQAKIQSLAEVIETIQHDSLGVSTIVYWPQFIKQGNS